MLIAVWRCSIFVADATSQSGSIKGILTCGGLPVAFAIIFINRTGIATVADTRGNFFTGNILPGSYTIQVSSVGFHDAGYRIALAENKTMQLEVQPIPESMILGNVVITRP